MGLSEKFVSEMARLVEGEVAAGRAEAVLERHHVEMLNKGMPLEAVALRGLPFAVNIVPLVAGGVLAAPRMPPVLANVRQTQREGWWPPIPPGGPAGAPPPFPPLPGGYGDVALDGNGDPTRPDWDPVNPTPNEHGKAFEYDPDTGTLSISSAGESVSLNWDELKPSAPISPSPLPMPCSRGQVHDEVLVSIDQIKASLREANCHTTIIISIKWKITRKKHICRHNPGRWVPIDPQPVDPPREETKMRHKSTKVTLPQN